MRIRIHVGHSMLIICFIGVVLLIGGKDFASTYAQETVVFDSPLPTPTPAPVISEYGQKALAFVAEKYAVPMDHLLIEYELETDYPLSGRTFRHFVISNTYDPRWTTYSVSVEIRTGVIEEDITGIERAEEAAHLAKYGKLEPALWERLQQVADDTVLPVAIWVAGQPIRTEDEILSILASEFPEAAKAMADGTKPTDVENPEAAAKIQARFEELLKENVEARLHPVEVWLNQEGYAFEKFEGMPSLTTMLPKSAIQRLAQMGEVGLLYFVEEKILPGLDVASASDRVTTVWQRGYTGTGVKVAMIDNNRINSPCLTIVATKNAALPLADHATKVANIVACNSDPYKGIAYNASIVDGNHDGTQPDFVNSLKWATESPQSAKAVNVSGGAELDGDIHWLDRAFDYWVRTRYFTAAVLSHNQNSYVRTPGKAWNVITVGGSNDQSNASWSDDVIANFSNYIDPTGGESGTDREKPEVAAPAVGITTANGNAAGPDGTSFAAPQIAGLAALLIHRNSQLQTWPEAVKAIIMASAVHNVDGPGDIDLTQDLKDGAGVIDAPLADWAAQFRQTSATDPCTTSCWWGISTNSSSPVVGNSLNRYFNGNRGERIRVVVAWMSNADTETNNYSFDRLDTNFDLRVYTSGGTLVKSALSIKNNYELVDFVAPQTTTYRIEVKKQSASENNNSLGIAWVKMATYLPNVRGATSFWTSAINVRNDGAEPRPVRITFFNVNGNFTSDVSTTLNQDQLWTPSPPSGWDGSAIVDGSEDISVLVANERDTFRERTSYTGILPTWGSGSPGWEKASESVYAPNIKRSIPPGLTARSSRVYVVNVGTQATTIQVEFRSDTGVLRNVGNFALNPNTLTVINSSDGGGVGGCDAANTICSAHIASNNGQPLAAVVNEYNDVDGNAAITHNIFRYGTNTIYFPVVKHKYFNNSTGIRVMNVSGTNASVTVAFHKQDGTQQCTLPNAVIPLKSAKTFVTNDTCPGLNFLGSAIITGDQPLVGMTNEASIDGRYKKDYASFHTGSRVAYGPLVYNNYTDTSGAVWNSGIGIQNLGTQQASVSLRYYDTTGSLVSAPAAIPINPRGMTAVAPAPNNFKGSVIVTADQDIIVMLNIINNTASGDSHASYNGPSR